MLTGSAVIRRASTLANLANEAATTSAGLAGTVIDRAIDLEATGAAIAMDIIANAAAARRVLKQKEVNIHCYDCLKTKRK